MKPLFIQLNRLTFSLIVWQCDCTYSSASNLSTLKAFSSSVSDSPSRWGTLPLATGGGPALERMEGFREPMLEAPSLRTIKAWKTKNNEERITRNLSFWLADLIRGICTASRRARERLRSCV
ncbi:hypothetical protein GOP47_0018275 [Adiantum capillus-veneris]|uniref:Secreted protein n=1 Tax=Adiantum capillus-veneris TaxID=13818 RepID=A0A9D4ZBF8_ADICA|nr:hypothetical protein GOP47_0018275 [Adiantum capillus-veneris]